MHAHIILLKRGVIKHICRLGSLKNCLENFLVERRDHSSYQAERETQRLYSVLWVILGTLKKDLQS